MGLLFCATKQMFLLAGSKEEEVAHTMGGKLVRICKMNNYEMDDVWPSLSGIFLWKSHEREY